VRLFRGESLWWDFAVGLRGWTSRWDFAVGLCGGTSRLGDYVAEVIPLAAHRSLLYIPLQPIPQIVRQIEERVGASRGGFVLLEALGACVKPYRKVGVGHIQVLM
jgi:hypothetical protein